LLLPYPDTADRGIDHGLRGHSYAGLAVYVMEVVAKYLRVL